MDQAKVATSLTNLGFCPKTVSTMLSFKAKSTQVRHSYRFARNA